MQKGALRTPFGNEGYGPKYPFWSRLSHWLTLKHLFPSCIPGPPDLGVIGRLRPCARTSRSVRDPSSVFPCGWADRRPGGLACHLGTFPYIHMVSMTPSACSFSSFFWVSPHERGALDVRARETVCVQHHREASHSTFRTGSSRDSLSVSSCCRWRRPS